jgi:hypothetical protein
MSDLAPQNFGAVSTRFANLQRKNDLAAGVQSGFGHIGYRGKTWSIRHRGEEKPIMRPDGDGPANSIEVVVLKSSAAVSKIWYEKGFVEGSNASPDCFSTNGVTPDAASTKKQAPTCATCPKNAWGSRITPLGKPGKACSDSKRLAVVPFNDIANEVFGGPMLLRVPAASLQDLATYGTRMDQIGFPYFAVGTRISFDPNQAYPKFEFRAIRPLSDAEADLVIEMRESPEVARILAEGIDDVTFESNQHPLAAAFEQPPQQTQTVAPSAPQTVAPPAAEPASPPIAGNATAFEAELDAKIDALLPG